MPPQITNLRVSQHPGTMFVDVYYDLIDPDSDVLWVGIQFSADGGTTYSIPADDLQGDLSFVTPGRDRHVVWNWSCNGAASRFYRARALTK